MAPTPQSNAVANTRSAFVPNTTPEYPTQYTRLLEFATPNCGPQFFMRFKLHCVPGQHPALAFCNAAGSVFFWDLKRLTSYQDFMERVKDPDRDRSIPLRPPSWLKTITHRKVTEGISRSRHGNQDRDSHSSAQGSQSSRTNGAKPSEETSEFNNETLDSWNSKYSMEDAYEPLRAHRTESSAKNFVGRQAAWSPGGEWCVVVGSSNFALITQRWAKKAPR